MSVKDSPYISAVKGRQEFRTALRKCRAEIKALKASRDELLEALQDARLLMFSLIGHEETFKGIVQNAKTLKEKEEE